MSTPCSIPVTVIGGYLGAGKTTLVNHLLRHADGKRLAILVNEFGELPIDADLIEAQDDDIISLSGGCVCCSYGNDLLLAMMTLAKLDPKPDHVILESSGVALPGAIASSLSLLDGFNVDGVVVLADAETIKQRSTDKYMADTVLRQLADADIVLLNKADLIEPQSLVELQAWIVDLAPKAKIVETQFAKAPVSVVLQNYLPQEMLAGKAHSPMSFHQLHGYETFVVEASEPVEPEPFVEQLLADNPTILRAKGFVENLDGEVITVQVVGNRYQLSPSRQNSDLGVVVIRRSGAPDAVGSVAL